MHKQRSIPIALAICLAVVTQVSGAQEVAAGWTICMRDLELVESIVERADEDGLVTVNEFGLRKTIPLDDIFFAVPTGAVEAPEAQQMATVPALAPTPVRLISLTDGQVIRGTIADPEDPESFAFSVIAGTGMHGDASVSLERLASVGDAPLLELLARHGPADEDILVTRTGDTLRGFIESIGLSTIIAAGADSIEIETAAIEALIIANVPDPTPGIYIYTGDNLRLRAHSFDFDFQQPMMLAVDTVSLGMGSDARETWILDPGAPRGVHAVGGGMRVQSLTTIEPESVEAIGERAWTPEPTVMDTGRRHAVLASIDLHAPVRVVYAVPEGTARFACTLEAQISTWTDCVARVTAIGYDGTRTELLNERLNARTPSVDLNTELGPRTARLEFTIEPGAYGPIQDRVILRRPRILVNED